MRQLEVAETGVVGCFRVVRECLPALAEMMGSVIFLVRRSSTRLVARRYKKNVVVVEKEDSM